MDYSLYPDSERYYSGAERKKGILIGKKPYIIKFRKNSLAGLKFNHVSEYLGSHIFQMFGIESQNTMLGTYRGEEVVIIEDFLKKGEVLIPFNGVGDSSLEDNIEGYRYNYQDIIRMLEDNIKLTNVEKTEERFWDVFVIDALLGNFDRHGSNWGFIKKENKYRIAPVFDNGSCLFPALNDDDRIKNILNNEDELNDRIYKFPTSQIKDEKGRKTSYYEVISAGKYPACNEALKRIVPLTDMEKLGRLIDSIDSISDVRKMFYKMILKLRFEKILQTAYQKL